MAQLIDTSVLIDLERRGVPGPAVDALFEGEVAALSSITASELLTGIYRTPSDTQKAKRLAFVESIFRLYPVLTFDLKVARIHARIWAELTSVGQMIGAYDLIIAATALTHDYEVLTLNLREFERVPGLVVRRPHW
jgi:predicted nucleic acid-binding protein